ncbi:MAG: hypothetical protein IJC76_05615 [Lachnospiraceae bacterium]|nr:hypothetical protein [Lachnospiraceae bacterium]
MTQEGNGFPEISLLLSLSDEFDITVNELLSAERLEEAEYKQKAEENMVNFIKEKEVILRVRIVAKRAGVRRFYQRNKRGGTKSYNV